MNDLKYEWRPLSTWPGKRRRPDEQCASKFGTSIVKTEQLLWRELRLIEAEHVVLEADCTAYHVRGDGMLRADAKLRSSAIILSFESRGKPLRFPCDTYLRWEDNMRAIALALEALRQIDRYGVTQHGEQYTGWEALPQPEDARLTAARTIAQFAAGYEVNAILQSTNATIDAANIALRKAHPDAGGSHEAFCNVVEARKLLLEPTAVARREK